MRQESEDVMQMRCLKTAGANVLYLYYFAILRKVIERDGAGRKPTFYSSSSISQFLGDGSANWWVFLV